MYDFDTVIDRCHTNSLKYDFKTERGKPADVLPLWVADMDFRAPACVINALADKCRHGIFGYADTGAQYTAVLKDWFARRFGFYIEPDWLVKTPGVVAAIHIAIKVLTKPDDAVVIQQPVYHPFASAVRLTGRKLVVNALVLQHGRYAVDFEDFEEKIAQNAVKLFILCNPHNPVGRVWTKAELTRLGDICLRHGVRVVSDEIHADIVYPTVTHQVFANLSPAHLDMTVTCTAPSKSFNLAGLQLSNIFIANEKHRRAFIKAYAASGLSQVNIMGITACEAAYKDGEPWLEALKDYLYNNLTFMRHFIARELPQLSLIQPEGTYLVWLDCCRLGLTPEKLNHFMLHRAGLWLSDGSQFGAGGEGFQRMNIACPQVVLRQALARLSQAI